MSHQQEYERTVRFADGAINHIKKNQVPAYPHSYEVWYSYLSGINQELIEAVDKLYSKYGRISATQMQDLHNNFLSKNPVGDKLDQMGESFDGEISRLLGILAKTTENKKGFSKILEQANHDLKSPLEQTEIVKLIKRLTIETKSIQNRNDALEQELYEARGNIEKLKKHLDEVREESVIDQLTMIGNRKHFDRNLELEVANHRDVGLPMSLILADVDHFKRFNDTWGHQAGDQVLRLVAMAIKNNVKNSDIPCRYGGEEFAIILPRTNLDSAMIVAERIRQTVFKRELIKRSSGENLGKISISAGVATLRANDLGPALIHRADLSLYAAKNAGRNAIVKETDPVMKDVA